MILFALCLLIMTAAVVFALQNDGFVQASFLIWDFDQPLALFLLAAFLAGVGSMLLITLALAIGHARKTRELTKRIKELENREDTTIVYKTGGLGSEGDATVI